MLLAADILSYHNELASTGVNSNETVLTRANVNSNAFGKLASLPVAGQIYAQPLIKRNVLVMPISTDIRIRHRLPELDTHANLRAKRLLQLDRPIRVIQELFPA